MLSSTQHISSTCSLRRSTLLSSTQHISSTCSLRRIWVRAVLYCSTIRFCSNSLAIMRQASPGKLARDPACRQPPPFKLDSKPRMPPWLEAVRACPWLEAAHACTTLCPSSQPRGQRAYHDQRRTFRHHLFVRYAHGLDDDCLFRSARCPPRLLRRLHVHRRRLVHELGGDRR